MDHRSGAKECLRLSASRLMSGLVLGGLILASLAVTAIHRATAAGPITLQTAAAGCYLSSGVPNMELGFIFNDPNSGAQITRLSFDVTAPASTSTGGTPVPGGTFHEDITVPSSLGTPGQSIVVIIALQATTASGQTVIGYGDYTVQNLVVSDSAGTTTTIPDNSSGYAAAGFPLLIGSAAQAASTCTLSPPTGGITVNPTVVPPATAAVTPPTATAMVQATASAIPTSATAPTAAATPVPGTSTPAAQVPTQTPISTPEVQPTPTETAQPIEVMTETPTPSAQLTVVVIHNKPRTVRGGRSTPCVRATNMKKLQSGCELISTVSATHATVVYTLSYPGPNGPTQVFTDTADLRGHSLHFFNVVYRPPARTAHGSRTTIVRVTVTATLPDGTTLRSGATRFTIIR